MGEKTPISKALTEAQADGLRDGRYRVAVDDQGRVVATHVASGRTATERTPRRAIEALE